MVLICRKLKSQDLILQKIEISRFNFTEMKNKVIFCRKMINQNFQCNYLLLLLLYVKQLDILLSTHVSCFNNALCMIYLYLLWKKTLSRFFIKKKKKKTHYFIHPPVISQLVSGLSLHSALVGSTITKNKIKEQLLEIIKKN